MTYSRQLFSSTLTQRRKKGAWNICYVDIKIAYVFYAQHCIRKRSLPRQNRNLSCVILKFFIIML